MFIIKFKKLYGLLYVVELTFLLALPIFNEGNTFNDSDLICYNVPEPKLPLNLSLSTHNCTNECDNISYKDQICHKDCSTFYFTCNCANETYFHCNATAFFYKCDCQKLPYSTLTTVLIIVTLVILLALLVALVAIILRRRRKALQRSQKYTLIARMSSEQQEDQNKKGKSVRIKSFRIVEEHSYEVVLPKCQQVSKIDQPKVKFDQYLNYIQKDGASENTGNDTLSFKQKETTPKTQIDVSFKNMPTDGKMSTVSVVAGPTQLMSTGYLSSLLSSQTEKFKRTRSSRRRQPTGFPLRRTASEWHTDRLASRPGEKTKSYGDLSKVPFYFELERSGSRSSQPGCDGSSSVTYDVAKCIPHLQ